MPYRAPGGLKALEVFRRDSGDMLVRPDAPSADGRFAPTESSPIAAL